MHFQFTSVLALAALATTAIAGGPCECCGNPIPTPPGCPTNGSKKRDMGFAVTNFPRQWLESLRARTAEPKPEVEVIEVKV